MAVFFHEVLLRCDRFAYLKGYQKKQCLFNPRRAPGAPGVGSADRGPQLPLRETLYLGLAFLAIFSSSWVLVLPRFPTEVSTVNLFVLAQIVTMYFFLNLRTWLWATLSGL